MNTSAVSDHDANGMFTALFDMFVSITPYGAVLEANDAYCRTLGYSAESLAQMNIVQIEVDSISPDDRWEELATAPFMVYEAQHCSVYGIMIEMEVCCRRDEKKGCIQMFCRHNSGKKSLENRLKTSERRLESLYQLGQKPAQSSEEELIGFTLEECIRLTGSSIGYFHFIDPTQQHIQFYHWSKSTALTCTITDMTHRPVEIAGVWADCVRTKGPVIHNDFASAADRKGMPEGHSPIHRHLSVPVLDEDGTVVIAAGVANKLTAYTQQDAQQIELMMSSLWRMVKRKRSDEATEQFRIILEQSPNSIVITDPKGVIQYVNPKFCQVTGYGKEEAIGQRPSILKSGETENAEYRSLWERISAGGIWHGEFHNRRKDGQLFWESATISPLRNSSNEITHFFAIKEDITEKKMVELELRRSHELFRATIASLDDLMFVLNSSGMIVDYSRPNALRAYLPDRMAFIGRSIDAVGFPSTLVRVFTEQIGTEKETMHAQEFLFYLQYEPATFWFDAKLSVRRDAAGAFDGVTILCRDISERIEQEGRREELTEELRLKNKDLEKTLAAMNSMQRSLIVSEKMASIGQLTAGIAHEINNPLAFVSSNINRFKEYFDDLTAVSDRWREAAHLPDGSGAAPAVQAETEADLPYIMEDFPRLFVNTRNGLDRIKKIVEQLRGFTYMADSQFSSTNINEAIDNSIEIVWNELKYKTTVVRRYGEIPAVECNSGEVKQVLVNLLINAAHAIATAGTITITTERSDASVLIRIADTGCGISAENLKKIFDPFFTTKPVGKGTGLGLWISTAIIEKHHGSLTAESTVGSGTTFTIALPLKQAATS